jgi:probable HAF family extracellular repeat protein
MHPLLPPSGDFASIALSINDRGEVVGSSFNTEFVFRAFLWRNGVMTDLNTLIPANSPLYLQLAASINASGEIVGFGQTINGEVHGFLATPSDGEDAHDGRGTIHPRVPSENARRLLIRRLGIRGR